MQTMNKWYDRLAVAMRSSDRAAREKEFDKIDEELDAAAKKTGTLSEVLKLVTAKDGNKTAGKALGDTLAGLLLPAVRKVQQAHDRISQVERNLQVAFAMAAYRADNNRYPEKLADLAPKYLAVVPGDFVFSGKRADLQAECSGLLVLQCGSQRQGRRRTGLQRRSARR